MNKFKKNKNYEKKYTYLTNNLFNKVIILLIIFPIKMLILHSFQNLIISLFV